MSDCKRTVYVSLFRNSSLLKWVCLDSTPAARWTLTALQIISGPTPRGPPTAPHAPYVAAPRLPTNSHPSKVTLQLPYTILTLTLMDLMVESYYDSISGPPYTIIKLISVNNNWDCVWPCVRDEQRGSSSRTLPRPAAARRILRRVGILQQLNKCPFHVV